VVDIRLPGGIAGATCQRPLPELDEVLHRMRCAEQSDGWLAECERRGEHLVVHRLLVERLAALLRRLSVGPILEVCAGSGRLVAALRESGLPVVAADNDSRYASSVVTCTALEALQKFRPAVVLGAFVPVDSDVDRQVMQFPTVRHYVVLAARLNGGFGTAALWRQGWEAQRLADVSAAMITRHDVYLGIPGRLVVQHGEAWHFARRADATA